MKNLALEENANQRQRENDAIKREGLRLQSSHN